MRFTVRSAIIPVALGLLGTQGSYAASFVSGFEPPSYVPFTELVPQDGWTINDPTADLSYIVSWNGSNAGLVGGLLSAPAILNVDLIHSFAAPLDGTNFDVDLSVQPSSASNPNRDAFGWSFKSGASDIMRVAFEPGIPGRLEIAWYDNANVRHVLTPISQDIFYNSPYHLSISFSSSGPDAQFNASLFGTNAVAWSGNLPGAGGASLTTFAADFDVRGATGINAGDNYMLFDGVSITNPIPEPAGALLAGVFCIGLVLRRKRG